MARPFIFDKMLQSSYYCRAALETSGAQKRYKVEAIANLRKYAKEFRDMAEVWEQFANEKETEMVEKGEV